MPIRIPTITDLDSSQRSVVQHTPYNDPMYVKGPPGSGKTHIAILRLNVLINEGYSNILFLLYNHSMYGFLRHIFKKMGLSDTININTKDKYFLDIALRNGYSYSLETNSINYNEKYNKRLHYLESISSLPRYDVIVIDECQDFLDRELRIIERMSPKIIAVGDSEQSVYQTDSQTFFRKLQAYELSTIYRYGKQVAAVAEHFSRQGRNLTSKVTNTNKSDVYKVKVTSKNDASRAIKQIVDAKRTTSMTIGILSISNKQLKALESDLGNAGISTFYCQNNIDIRNYDFDSRKPILITPHSAKGMEFDCVILVGYNDILLYGDFKNVWKEIVYVSLTRTCNELYLIEEEDTKPELKVLREWKELSANSGSITQRYDF